MIVPITVPSEPEAVIAVEVTVSPSYDDHPVAIPMLEASVIPITIVTAHNDSLRLHGRRHRQGNADCCYGG
jgi:hypothetical protein